MTTQAIPWPGTTVIPDGHWLPVSDQLPAVMAMYRRHYSAGRARSERRRLRPNVGGIVGPCPRIVLMTVDGRAIFAWANPNPAYRDDHQEGIRCAVFRNESGILSSTLILEAEEIAWTKWPRQRLYTYVEDRKVASVNPGYCFKIAGWRTCGRNKDGRLSILEKLP